MPVNVNIHIDRPGFGLHREESVKLQLVVRGDTLHVKSCHGYAPTAGGPKSSELTPEQKAQDRAARLAVSDGLGHGREEITAVCLGVASF